jgi:hypothetical protein
MNCGEKDQMTNGVLFNGSLKECIWQLHIIANAYIPIYGKNQKHLKRSECY